MSYNNSYNYRSRIAERNSIRVALAGNPNSGKTSIFNALTGANHHVGNYPGVTVEKREGHYRFNNTRYEVLDLPGTYSLSGYSPEERIAQEELLKGEYDVIVAVVDSTALKRSLVFICQLMQLNVKLVLCLNMSDEARATGQIINISQFEKLVGFPVIETVGHKGDGMDNLREAILRASNSDAVEYRLVLGERLGATIRSIQVSLPPSLAKTPASGWMAIRLLQKDAAIANFLASAGSIPPSHTIQVIDQQRTKLEAETGQDISLFVMEQYYGFVDGLLREILIEPPRRNARIVSDAIDSLLSNRLLGLPIFLLVMYGVFWITFTLGAYPMDWIKDGFAWFSSHASGLWPSGSESALRSLIVDGVIAGVGGVVVFLPNIVLLFACLAFLEDTGYMARAAFLMDKFMHLFGLHGRSFIPFVTGFGCSIPGIMATRTLENERDRLTTMLVLPLMSCGARLPIWMLLVPAFFSPERRPLVLWLIYVIGIALALVLSLLLRRTLLKGEDAPFVMELPPYRMPTVRAIGNRVLERAWLYLRKAGTIILAISVILWALTSYPKKDHFDIDAQIAAKDVPALSTEELEHTHASESLRYSFAGRIGQAMEPIIRPLGFNWKIGVGMVGAFAAKEVFVTQMGILYSLGEPEKDRFDLQAAIRKEYSPIVGFSLILFMLIATPCMATVAVTRRESGRWKWALLQFFGLTLVAYIISCVFYQIGSRVL